MTIASGNDLKVVQDINLVGGVVAQNAYYFRTQFTTAQEEADIVDAIEEWIEDLYNELGPQVVSGVSLGTMRVYHWQLAAGQWDLIGSGTPTDNFAATGDMLPHGVAALVRVYTENPRTISRVYLAGFDEGTIADGVFTSGCLSDLADYGGRRDNIKQIDIGESLLPAVWDTTVLTGQEIINEFVVPVNPGYQRRRRPGVGI